MLASPCDAIRQQVRETFRECGAPGDAPLRETMLIRDGFFCGRRFQLDGLTAVWFVEESELKIYDREGTLMSVQTPAAESGVAARKAA